MASGSGDTATRCAYTTRAGIPCRQPARFSDGGCAFHSQSPDGIAARLEAARKGGAGKSTAARAAALTDHAAFPVLLTPTDVSALVGVALRQTLAGRLDPATAGAVASLARAWTAVHETAVLAERLDGVERALAVVEVRR